MAKRVSDKERQQIIAEFPTGKSCNEIAALFGRAPDTISRIARDEGHTFGYTNLKAAHEASRAYNEERRQRLRLDTVDKAERVLAQMFESAVVFSFGGRDNTYNEHEMDKPPPRDQRDIAQTFKTLMSVVFEIDKREAGGDDERGVLGRLFEQIQAEADDYDSASDQ